MYDVEISFPGGKAVDARIGLHTIHTDQPIAEGGQNAAPSPFDLFLASLGTCAGYYVLTFCQRHGIATADIRIYERCRVDEHGQLVQVELDIVLPADFPVRYRDAVALSAESCKVRTTLSTPPVILVHSRIANDSRPHAA
jgi:ribosomal protein S12 methylthiotransferase accessory factor